MSNHSASNGRVLLRVKLQARKRHLIAGVHASVVHRDDLYRTRIPCGTAKQAVDAPWQSLLFVEGWNDE
jgi:hypothetical protein